MNWDLFEKERISHGRRRGKGYYQGKVKGKGLWQKRALCGQGTGRISGQLEPGNKLQCFGELSRMYLRYEDFAFRRKRLASGRAGRAHNLRGEALRRK